jgi:hypothetical protein
MIACVLGCAVASAQEPRGVRVEGIAALVGGASPGPGVEIVLRSDVDLRARISLADISAGGGKLDIGLWGDNLTNQRNIDFGIDFGSLGYGSASFKKKRTFGVDAKFTY